MHRSQPWVVIALAPCCHSSENDESLHSFCVFRSNVNNLDPRYPHPATCVKTSMRFGDGAATPQRRRDIHLCKSVDARGETSTFSRYVSQKVEPQRGSIAKTMVRTIPGDLAKGRSVHESATVIRHASQNGKQPFEIQNANFLLTERQLRGDAFWNDGEVNQQHHCRP